jgi:hypothetical protein
MSGILCSNHRGSLDKVSGRASCEGKDLCVFDILDDSTEGHGAKPKAMRGFLFFFAVAFADLRAQFVASCFLRNLPLVLLLALCFVRAMVLLSSFLLLYGF